MRLLHWSLVPISLAAAEMRTTCSTVQLEAYCDIQITAFDSTYEKTTTYSFDESYTRLMTELTKKSDSSSSSTHGGSLGFKGFSISGDAKTSKNLKTYLKQSLDVVVYDKGIRDNTNEKKIEFQPNTYQYFRVIDSILTVDGHVYETTAKEFVYSSPSHDEYDKILDRYCPRQMRREFKTKELDYDSGPQQVCVEEQIPIHNGMRVCFSEREGSSQCQRSRNTCSGWSSKPEWTDPFRDDTDKRGGGCHYHWRVEELKPQPNYEYRLCFREIEGSSQCQGSRNSCSGWTSSPAWTQGFRDDTDRRGGGCTYQWKTEQRKVTSKKSVPAPTCRICFKETEGSSQCQRSRNTCSGWSSDSNPAWTATYRDDTDGRSGGCRYHWYMDCVPDYAKKTCRAGHSPCI